MINSGKNVAKVYRLIGCCAVLSCISSLAFASGLPSLADYGINKLDLVFPESVTGIVMEAPRGNSFVLHEKKHLLFRETEFNGKPIERASFILRKGTRVKVVRYPLKNKSYFVASLTILR